MAPNCVVCLALPRSDADVPAVSLSLSLSPLLYGALRRRLFSYILLGEELKPCSQTSIGCQM